MSADQLRAVSDALHNGAEAGEVWGKIAPKCDHNEMVAYGDDLLHAWACAKCGYIYGQAERAEGKEE